MSVPPPTCIQGHAMKVRHYKDGDVWVCAEDCDFTMQTNPGDYRDPEASSEEVTCSCGCGEVFVPAFRHPDQEYLNVAHRMRAYRRRRKEATP